MTLGIDNSIIHVCILMQELCFDLKRSSSLRDTRKESQQLPVTIIYLVGFNHDAELPYKKINSREKFGAITLEPGINWVNLLFLWKSTDIQSCLTADLILEIPFGLPKCAWPHPYKWTESNRCIYLCLMGHSFVKWAKKKENSDLPSPY